MHRRSPLDRRIVLFVGWLRRVANIVGPSLVVACAPPAFRQGRVRVLTYDNGHASHDRKARFKSFLLFPLRLHRMLSLPSPEILTGHHSPANGGPVDPTGNAPAARVTASDFYTTLILFSLQPIPQHGPRTTKCIPGETTRLMQIGSK